VEPLYFLPSTPVVAKVLKLSTVFGTSFPKIKKIKQNKKNGMNNKAKM
jgi:hypothetical protein